MKLPHDRPAAERASPNRAALRRCAVLCAIGLLGIAAVVVPLDYGHYGEEWRRQGLLGFLRLRSVLALHVGFFAATIALFMVGFWGGLGQTLRGTVWLLGAAAGVYGMSIYLIREACRAGEFGIGTVGFVALFGLMPSAALLILGVPIAIIHALRKDHA